MALSLPREGALWTINPSRPALFGLGSLIMGSLIQYNLQAGWTHLEQKPWDAHGDISIYLWGKAAEEVGRKRRNNKEEKGEIIRREKKDGSDDSSMWKIQTRGEDGNVSHSCREMLFRTCLHDQPGVQDLGSTPSCGVSYILSPASSWAKHSFKIPPPTDFSFRCTFCTFSLNLFFTSQGFGVVSQAGQIVSAPIWKQEHINWENFEVKKSPSERLKPWDVYRAENTGDPTRNRWWKEHTGKGWRKNKRFKGKARGSN